MNSHLIATNGFMAFIWLILTIAAATLLGPAIIGDSTDPETADIASAITGPVVTAGILLLCAYVAATAGTAVEQSWGRGLTMMLLPVTTLLTPPLFFIAAWQTVALLRRPA